MAYTFFPKTEDEICKKIKTAKQVGDITNLFYFLRNKFPAVETPININLETLGKVNVSRSLEGSVDLATIKREIGLSKIIIRFGSGSSGNRGVNNRGNLFEPQFAYAFLDWWTATKEPEQKMLNVCRELRDEYDLCAYNTLRWEAEGALNKKRPVVFSPNIIISAPGVIPGGDIGSIVTDLSLYGTKTEPNSREQFIAYFSLKLGTTATFFNVGIKTVLTTKEIQEGSIKNHEGLKLLNMLGIDNLKFCKIFNGRSFTNLESKKDDVWSAVDKGALETFLSSGIGHGYHIIHKLSNEIKSIKVDKNYMKEASTPTSCVVYYGGMGGNGKRIDIEIKTSHYKFKLNIRDTQGQGGYPTRLMGDFSYV